MSKRKSATIGAGTVGQQSQAKHSRAEAVKSRRGTKTQGSCSGHETCRAHGGKRTATGKCDKGMGR